MDQQSIEKLLASIEDAKNFVISKIKITPTIGLISGSGLGGLADLLCDSIRIPYEDIPHFVQPTVPGHAGNLVFGHVEGKYVACMQGRLHGYEGHSLWEVTFPVRVLAALGVKVLILTNTSGGLNSGYSVGDFVIIKDHINICGLTGQNPLIGLNDERFGERFCLMSKAYDPKLRACARQASRDLGMEGCTREGVYAAQMGPSIETVAECRMLKQWGADSIGMSVVHEVTVGVSIGLRCLAISLITNMSVMELADEVSGNNNHSNSCCGIVEEVLTCGKLRQGQLSALIGHIIKDLK